MIKKLAPNEKVSFTAHLEELRKRLIFCVVFLSVAFLGCFAVSDRLLAPFAKLLGTKLVFLAPLEAFMAYMSLSFYAALAVSVPVISYHAWAFIAPALRDSELRYAFPMVFAASVLFFTGVAFCWFAVLPLTVKFLMGYGGDLMTPMISVKAYLHFCLSMLLVFGLVFELPLVVVLIHAAGLVSFQSLKSFRRYWIVAAFILGAILSPSPDVISQTLAAVPLIVLYELSILYIYFVIRGKEGEKNTA